jgi:7-cyano-7-deazaguanine reductase
MSRIKDKNGTGQALSEKQEQLVLESSPLGNHTAYINEYDASLLFPIERNINWNKRGIDRAALPFMQVAGAIDIWNGYEISWLNNKGKPIVRVAQFRFSAHSAYIIESKSFKLYLNSYNLSQFESQEDVIAQMQIDLSTASGTAVEVIFYSLDSVPDVQAFKGTCIDDCDVQINQYSPDPELLVADEQQQIAETLISHILKSNCPVTGQPDWASVCVNYKGAKISQSALLKYFVSYREHGDFHEQCVENIFMDIWQQCKPSELSVYARYIRRGGLDINPFRSSVDSVADNLRLSRQ